MYHFFAIFCVLQILFFAMWENMGKYLGEVLFKRVFLRYSSPFYIAHCFDFSHHLSIRISVQDTANYSYVFGSSFYPTRLNNYKGFCSLQLKLLWTSRKHTLEQPCSASGQLAECGQIGDFVRPNAPSPQKKVETYFGLVVQFEKWETIFWILSHLKF